jgi:hypothetical protein
MSKHFSETNRSLEEEFLKVRRVWYVKQESNAD